MLTLVRDGWGELRHGPWQYQDPCRGVRATNAIYLGSTQDGKQVGVQTTSDGGHPVAQLQTLLAPGESTTFRVAFLGEAKFANAGVQAISTPGVRQGKVEPLSIDCASPAQG